MKYLFSFFTILLTSALWSADIAVVTMAIGEEYKKCVSIGIENKRIYCARHGYDFICLEDSLDTSRPVPWSKIPLLLHVMNNNYKWIFWTDADSLIMNMGIKLESLIDENYNLVLSKPLNSINSGQFLIRNCEWSKNFLHKSYQYKEFIYHPWWEQMGIIKEIENNPDHLNFMKFIAPKLLNAFPANFCGGDYLSAFSEGDFILHFASVRDVNGLKSLFEHYSNIIKH